MQDLVSTVLSILMYFLALWRSEVLHYYIVAGKVEATKKLCTKIGFSNMFWRFNQRRKSSSYVMLEDNHNFRSVI
jgi:hypothetical protein